jgi:branched-chain amino acid transport system substrate-binding protein
MRIACGTRIAAALAAAAVAFPLLAGDAAAPPQTGQEQLTVYSSMPHVGAGRFQTQALVRGARLALEEAGGRAGTHPLRLVSLNNGSRFAGTWTPRRTARNAVRAAMDESSVAYIGEFNSGASAISMPILNEVPLAQISPTSTAVGLTRDVPGADRGEPYKYVPTGRRTFFRISPNDRVQGRALTAAMRDRGCRRIAVLNDGEVYGVGLGVTIRRTAPGLGLRVVHAGRIQVRRRSFRGLARRLRRLRAECVAFAGITANSAVPLFRDLARGMPNARFFAGDGVADSGFTEPREGGVAPRVGRRILITVSTLAPDALPEAGRAMLQRYTARYGDQFPDPNAVLGYESMRLVIDAVAAVGPGRRAVIRWLRAVQNRPGLVGTYGFDRFGDTTFRTFGLYGIRDGVLVWTGTTSAP